MSLDKISVILRVKKLLITIINDKHCVLDEMARIINKILYFFDKNWTLNQYFG